MPTPFQWFQIGQATLLLLAAVLLFASRTSMAYGAGRVKTADQLQALETLALSHTGRLDKAGREMSELATKLQPLLLRAEQIEIDLAYTKRWRDGTYATEYMTLLKRVYELIGRVDTNGANIERIDRELIRLREAAERRRFPREGSSD